MFQADSDGLVNEKKVIYCCERFRELKLIVRKAVLGINLNDEEVQKFAVVMGCSIQNWLISYLGTPFVGNLKSMASWSQ